MGFNSLDELIEKANEVMGKVSGKKLTTKDRKKMKSTTFCGPGRSFPIPDCKHVAVAKTYLARSKFSASTKKKIAACINRKAKQLGCNVSKKAKADEEIFMYKNLSTEEKQIYSSEIFKETRALVEQSIKSPDMELYTTEESDCPCKDGNE
ncbi:MAG: hypothetical protein PVG39_02280 [Desulfobacteraceae bacterium]